MKGRLKSSQSGSSSSMNGIMPTLKKLGISFTRVQMWKHYNKLRKVNTADIDGEEFPSHWEALRFIKNDLNFANQNTTEVQDEGDE
jgi:hypothetical protein